MGFILGRNHDHPELFDRPGLRRNPGVGQKATHTPPIRRGCPSGKPFRGLPEGWNSKKIQRNCDGKKAEQMDQTKRILVGVALIISWALASFCG